MNTFDKKIMKKILTYLFFIYSMASAQIIDTCCINPAWVDPNAICVMIWDPVIGCDGVQYSNDCVAQAAGITSWTDQSGQISTLNWDCISSPSPLCISPSGVEIFLPDLWVNPNNPCEMGECTPNGDFVQIIIDCMEEMGIPCVGEWVQIEGQCCSECIEPDYCDSINLNPILPLDGSMDDALMVNIETSFTSYSIPYAGLILFDNMGDTVAIETLSTAGNVYGIGPYTSETRSLLFLKELIFPFTGEICIVEGLFAGNSNIVCSYQVTWEHVGLNEIEDHNEVKLVKMLDIMGREQHNHKPGQLLFYIFNDGTIQKNTRIE